MRALLLGVAVFTACSAPPCSEPMFQSDGATCCWEYEERACRSGSVCLVGASGEATCSAATAVSIPKWGALYERCDTAHGADACATTLMCGSLPGMTASTCMVPATIADMEPCLDGKQCASGSCNPTEKACRSRRGTPCVRDIGCANEDATCQTAQSTSICL